MATVENLPSPAQERPIGFGRLKRKEDARFIRGKGNYLDDIELTFTVRFPEGEAGDKARAILPRAIAMSHDRICTVSQTVQRGTPITVREV